MWGLRRINNGYTGGTRSDFVIIGHPEFNLGQAGSESGLGPGWDCRPNPHHPRSSEAGERLRRAGSGSLLARLTAAPAPATCEGLKGRALAHGRRAASCAPVVPLGFDGLLAMLRAGESALPTCAPPDRVTAGAANHLSTSSICGHYAALTEELASLAGRLRRDPDGTEHALLATGSWKHYAQALDDARRREARLVAQRRGAAVRYAPLAEPAA